jgi:hypothetical protein
MELVVGGRNGGVVCLSGGYDSTLTSIPANNSSFARESFVYPNPCDDILHVAVTLQQSSGVVISVNAMNGQLVYSSRKSANSGRTVFDLETGLFAGETMPGMYIVTVETAMNISHFKIVFHQRLK